MMPHRWLFKLTLGSAAALVCVVLAGLGAYAAIGGLEPRPTLMPTRVATKSARATPEPVTTTDALLVGAPLTAAQAPASHADWRWTIRHRDTSIQDRAGCSTCHSQSFCETCHRNTPPHPRDISYTHPQIIKAYKNTGKLGCYTCHQNVGCQKCHSGDVVGNP